MSNPVSDLADLCGCLDQNYEYRWSTEGRFSARSRPEPPTNVSRYPEVGSQRSDLASESLLV